LNQKQTNYVGHEIEIMLLSHFNMLLLKQFLQSAKKCSNLLLVAHNGAHHAPLLVEKE